MAIVNVDYSEYDTLRKRESELDMLVKELKKENKELKSGERVILRTVTIEKTYELDGFAFSRGRSDNKLVNTEKHVTESYVNFDDVHKQVEERMRDELQASIEDYKSKADEYSKERAGLEAEMRKKLKEENDRMRDAYKDKFAESERKRNALILRLNEVNRYARIAYLILSNRLFRSKKAIEMIERIKDISYNNTKDGE